MGETIEKIAFEKAGIIKHKCPVLVSSRNNGFETINTIAKEKSSKVLDCCNNVDLVYEYGKNYVVFENKKYEFSLLGLWQKENLKLVFGVINYLKSVGYDISEDAIKRGLATVNWICRMQYIPRYNLLFDGTHNPDGARVLRESLDYYFPNKKRTWIYGSLTTKDYATVMNTLFQPEDEVFFYNFEYPNSVKFEELCKIREKACQINLKELEYLVGENNDAVVIVSGSFYMIGQIIAKSNFFQNITKVVNIYSHPLST